ncbi:hypothetical protein D3C86_1844450 [compost metagenome]
MPSSNPRPHPIGIATATVTSVLTADTHNPVKRKYARQPPTNSASFLPPNKALNSVSTNTIENHGIGGSVNGAEPKTLNLKPSTSKPPRKRWGNASTPDIAREISTMV